MQKNNKKGNTEITATIGDVVNLKDDFQTIPPEKLTEIFKKALEYDGMKALIDTHIVSALRKDDEVRAVLIKIVDEVNHSKWKLIYTKTYSVALPFATLILGWILSHFFGK